ncbi:uncharacterized protein LOC126895110 [Daktulosphaira vitifoliae]|uniref:uncharacterized protein LOC126895110 n=1 Tax=Daktulosphaira vitifoliae TaxID=58002 RepID=UPI0021AA7F9B|nr:uncharacterized protein LOC126895110 [Daktulosphaira vitifoliae]
MEETLLKVQYVEQICKSGIPVDILTPDSIKNENDSNIKFWIETHISKFRCMYMFNALQHMRLSRNLFKAHLKNSIIIPIIVKYKEIIQEILALLYSLGVRELNGLWLLYVYIEILLAHLAEKDFLNILNTRNFELLSYQNSILNRLEFLSRSPYCENSTSYQCDFKSTDYDVQECEDGDKEECLKKVELLVDKNISNIHDLKKKLADNGIVSNNLEWFSIERLYINDVVKSDTFIKTLIETFNVDIEWNSVQNDLINFNIQSHNIHFLLFGSINLRFYQSSFLGFIKLFIIRMTRRHFMYIRDEYTPLKKCINKLANKEDKQVRYTIEIERMLLKFINFFDLPKDDELQEIIKILYKPKRYINQDPLSSSMYDEPIENSLNKIKNLEKNIIRNHFPNVQLKSLSLNKPKSATFYRTLGFAVSQNINLGHNLMEFLDFNSIDLNLMMIKVFYKYLKYNNVFQNINFDVIISFLTSLESHCYLRVPIELVYKYNDKELAEKMRIY